MQTIIKISQTLCVAIFVLLLGSTTANGEQSKMLKQGFYKSVGLGAGYYYYGEVDGYDAFLMRMDNLALNIAGNIGYITQNGFKFDMYLDANFAIGIYIGSILDTVEEEKDGKSMLQINVSTYYHAQTLLGYNPLAYLTRRASLYLQAGVGYYFNRNDFSPYERLQGNAYIPIEIESEIVLNDSWALNFMGGFRYFIIGNHLTRLSRVHYSNDLHLTQKDGLGASGFIGARYIAKRGGINSFGLRYEYWHLKASTRSNSTNYKGVNGPFVEPKNASHIITFQYGWEF